MIISFVTICNLFLALGQEDDEMKKTNATLIKRNGEKSYIIIDGLKTDQYYLFATVVVNEGMECNRSNFTEGHPIMTEGTLTA